jgi:hypothetical protein
MKLYWYYQTALFVPMLFIFPPGTVAGLLYFYYWFKPETKKYFGIAPPTTPPNVQ